MSKWFTIVLKVFATIGSVVAIAGIMFSVFRFIESTNKTNESHERIIHALDSTRKIVDEIHSDVGDIKKEFVIFQKEVTNEINAHEQSYKEFLSKYANLNTEQYVNLTDGIKGLRDDIKKNGRQTLSETE